MTKNEYSILIQKQLRKGNCNKNFPIVTIAYYIIVWYTKTDYTPGGVYDRIDFFTKESFATPGRN